MEPARRYGLAATLGLVLPFCTYLYTEQQKLRDTLQQRQEQQRAAEARRVEQDRSQARNLHTEITMRFPRESLGTEHMRQQLLTLCEHLDLQLDAITTGLYGPLSLQVIHSTLAAQLTLDSAPTSIACQCGRFADANTALLGAPPRALLASVPRHNLNGWRDSLTELRQGCAPTPANGMASPAAADSAVQQTRKDQLQALDGPLPRVYIQYPDAATRGTAACLARALTALGYQVPPLEQVGARAPPSSQLRYFKAEEREVGLTLAQDLERIAQQPGCAAAGVPEIRDFTRLRAQLRPWHYELWLKPGPPADASDASDAPHP